MPLAKALVKLNKEEKSILTTSVSKRADDLNQELPLNSLGSEVRNIVPDTQQFIIESAKTTLDYPQVIIDHAMQLCEMNSIVKGFLQYIRCLLAQKENIKNFEYSFGGRTEEEIKHIVVWLKELTGAFRRVQYDKNSKVVSGEIVQTARVRCFLSGKYLEIAISQKVRGMVEKLANEYGVTYAVYDNACVSTLDGLKRNEFDLLVNVDTSWFVLEVKSGDTEPDWKKYYDIGKRYDFVPNHFMLVSSCIEEEAAESATWFNEYYVTNLERMEDTFIAMVKRTLK